MLNSIIGKFDRIKAKRQKRFALLQDKIVGLEKRIESNHQLGDIKVQLTNKLEMLIWKRVVFVEYQAEKINDQARSFVCSSYQVTAPNELTLIKELPALYASAYFRRKISRALTMLSNSLSCSKELDYIARIIKLL